MDPSLFEGMNVFTGRILDQPTDCGWTFQGYAIPLLEPHDNERWWHTSTNPGPWSSNLNYHVATTSTSTVWLSQECTWRLYMQNAGLEPDAPTAQQGVTVPERNPADLTGTSLQYPEWGGASPSWESSGRFERGYISFVDSPDAGLHFPIFAPKAIGAVAKGPSNIRWDWRHAGWTPTAIPCLFPTSPADGSGIYTRYQDVTVLDLKAEIGWYVMVAIEARTRTPDPTRGGCHAPDSVCGSDCDVGWPGSPDVPGSTVRFPFTRVVLFFCKDPGFGHDGQPVYPRPGWQASSAVLLAPDRGGAADQPAASRPIVIAPPRGTRAPKPPPSDCPNEWYGVPHAVVLPSRTGVLFYVPWQGTGADNFAYVPQRVARRYPADGTYLNTRYAPLPPWQSGVGGISAFLVDVHELRTIAQELESGLDSDAADLLSNAVQTGYLGEVLISNGQPVGHPPDIFPMAPGPNPDVPGPSPAVTDPQWAWVESGGTPALRVYWDSQHDLGPTENDTDQLWRATKVTAPELESAAATSSGSTASFSHVLGPNGPYTVFLTQAPCDLQFDLRQLFQVLPTAQDPAEIPGSYGKLVADPDVVELALGQLRASFFGGSPGEGKPSGLLCALTTSPPPENTNETTAPDRVVHYRDPSSQVPG